MTRGLAIVLLAVAACGSVGGSPDASPHPDSAAGLDGPPARCSPTAPFGTPSLVAGLNLNTTAQEYNAQLTPDELGMFFVRDPGTIGGADVYVTTRTSTSGDFATPTALADVDGANSNEFGPTVTADGLTMFLTTNATGSIGSGYDIFISTRATPSSSFSSPTPETIVNTDAVERGAYVTPSGHALYFSRYTPATPLDEVIYRAPVGPAGLETPVAVPGITMAPAGLPVVTPDELTLYFVSSSGGVDNNIWIATRTSATADFGAPTKITELSADGTNEEPSWISGDNCVLYFASDRGGSGYDMYVAQRGH